MQEYYMRSHLKLPVGLVQVNLTKCQMQLKNLKHVINFSYFDVQLVVQSVGIENAD